MARVLPTPILAQRNHRILRPGPGLITGGVGAAGGVELPWGYSFVGQDEGVEFGNEWSNTVGGYDTLTADSTGLETWDPVQTVGNFRSDGGAGDVTYCFSDLAIGGAVDIVGGFKFRIWFRLTQDRDTFAGFFKFLDENGDPVVYGRMGGADTSTTCQFYNDGESLFATANGTWTNANINVWTYYDFNYQPESDEVIFQGHKWDGDVFIDTRTNATSIGMGGWDPNPITQLMTGASTGNVWVQDQHHAGYWIGGPEDLPPGSPPSDLYG